MSRWATCPRGGSTSSDRLPAQLSQSRWHTCCAAGPRRRKPAGRRDCRSTGATDSLLSAIYLRVHAAITDGTPEPAYSRPRRARGIQGASMQTVTTVPGRSRRRSTFIVACLSAALVPALTGCAPLSANAVLPDKPGHWQVTGAKPARPSARDLLMAAYQDYWPADAHGPASPATRHADPNLPGGRSAP